MMVCIFRPFWCTIHSFWSYARITSLGPLFMVAISRLSFLKHSMKITCGDRHPCAASLELRWKGLGIKFKSVKNCKCTSSYIFLLYTGLFLCFSEIIFRLFYDLQAKKTSTHTFFFSILKYPQSRLDSTVDQFVRVGQWLNSSTPNENGSKGLGQLEWKRQKPVPYNFYIKRVLFLYLNRTRLEGNIY